MEWRTIEVDEYPGIMIGKQGCNVKEIRQVSGALDIWVDDTPSTRGKRTCNVIISGSSEAVSKANELVLALSQRLQRERLAGPSLTKHARLRAEQLGVVVANLDQCRDLRAVLTPSGDRVVTFLPGGRTRVSVDDPSRGELAVERNARSYMLPAQRRSGGGRGTGGPSLLEERRAHERRQREVYEQQQLQQKQVTRGHTQREEAEQQQPQQRQQQGRHGSRRVRSYVRRLHAHENQSWDDWKEGEFEAFVEGCATSIPPPAE